MYLQASNFKGFYGSRAVEPRNKGGAESLNVYGINITILETEQFKEAEVVLNGNISSVNAAWKGMKKKKSKKKKRKWSEVL